MFAVICRTIVVLFVALWAALAHAREPSMRPGPTLTSLQSTVDWINDFRRTRDTARAPLAIRALSYYGGFKEPEAAGVYVGFIAGIIGSDPDQADKLIDAMLPVRDEDQWAVVRGIAYSGLPNWQDVLRRHAHKLEGRQTMVADYLNGRLPTLGKLTIKPSPTTWERVKENFAINWPGEIKPEKPIMLEPSQEVLDILWGYYLASDSYAPILRVVELLAWSKDRDSVDKLTVGSMAKYTLASNASRDAKLLGKLQTIRDAKGQNQDTKILLDDVIHAAQIADSGRLRKDALAAIEQLKIKGPNYKREVGTWAKVGQGTLAVGCVAAAVAGAAMLGLPCVVAGGASNAAMYYMND